jgi:hypothetical protein
METCYYFISSPLHFLYSVNMAIRHSDKRNVAVITSFIDSNAGLLARVIRRDGKVFSDLITFENQPGKSKTSQRKQRMKVLRDYIDAHPAEKIFTGSDRHVEFQYAMHCAHRLNPAVEGIYLDEGTHTYLGNKRMYRLQHKYGDALLKKLYYGFWWKNPVIIGTSGWIQKIYATFPALVHPLYKEKTVLPVDGRYFDDPAFERIAGILMNEVQIDRSTLSSVDFVVLLTHDTHYGDADAHIERLMQILSAHCAPERIAIKAHPRSRLLATLKARYPKSVHLDNRVGFELLLPLFEEHCVFVGDVTSALFTIKWFKPDRQVIAIQVEQPEIAHFAAPLQKLFHSVNIRQLTYQQLDAELAGLEAVASAG